MILDKQHQEAKKIAEEKIIRFYQAIKGLRVLQKVTSLSPYEGSSFMREKKKVAFLGYIAGAH